MNGPCDADNDYVLFATGASNITRSWYRSQGSGRNDCTINSQEKLNYHVLKHPPSAMAEPSPRSPGSRSTTVLSLGMLKTVQLEGRLYSIDPLIYEAVASSLIDNPVQTACELKKRIDEIRIITEIPAPLNVRLANVGLNNYTKRYTYQTAGSKLPSTKTTSAANRVFDAILKTSGYAKEVLVYVITFQEVVQNFIKIKIRFENYVPIYLLPQWSDLQNAFADYASYFPLKTLNLNKSQFILISENTGCSYTGDVTQMFPGGTASLFGTKVLSTKAIGNYFRSGAKAFMPIPCTLTQTSGSISKVGVLIGFKLEKNLSEKFEIIFVPAESDLDKIQTPDWGVGVGLTIDPI